ncbi:PKD domain-containing protein [Pleionea sp. CnH1-48]|uniref:PKD domain-containing protein n=1 Tax=Pleionea sp. CnH1-48 TaxID=2954494 RepID=UPI002096CD4D|nr:PKD domain-containing protein [Pleionea sp. CnH1-48]MCO7222732.1 PKD domain-containing protein [Pleionea sp. CnH1-48]
MKHKIFMIGILSLIYFGSASADGDKNDLLLGDLINTQSNTIDRNVFSDFREYVSRLYFFNKSKSEHLMPGQSIITFSQDEVVPLGMSLKFLSDSFAADELRILSISKTSLSGTIDSKHVVEQFFVTFSDDNRIQLGEISFSPESEKGMSVTLVSDKDHIYINDFNPAQELVLQSKKNMNVESKSYYPGNDIVSEHFVDSLRGNPKKYIVNTQQETAEQIYEEYKLNKGFKNIKTSPTMINVLFVAERNYIKHFKSLENATNTLSNKSVLILNEMNRIMQRHNRSDLMFSSTYVTETGTNALGLTFAPTTIECIGDQSSACPTSYSYALSLAHTTLDPNIIELRKNKKFDIVIVFRQNPYVNGVELTDGAAVPPTQIDDNNAINRYVGVVHLKWSYPWNGPYMHRNIRHEIGHLLSAGHSEYNAQPGAIPRRAFINEFFMDWKGTWRPFSTIVGYGYVCERVLPPHSRRQDCHYMTQYSDRFLSISWSDVHGVRTGDSTHDNFGSMATFFGHVANYSDIVNKNFPPTARISSDDYPTWNGESLLTVPPQQVVTYNSNQSSDPNGDPLTYYWQIKTGPKTVASSRNSSISYSSPNETTYQVFLTATDSKNLSHRKEVSIQVKGDITTSKPNLRVTIDGGTLNQKPNYKLYWEPVVDATRYKIYKDGQWFSQTSLLQYLVKYTDLPKGSTNYQIQACKGVVCGLLSNAVTLKK